MFVVVVVARIQGGVGSRTVCAALCAHMSGGGCSGKGGIHCSPCLVLCQLQFWHRAGALLVAELVCSMPTNMDKYGEGQENGVYSCQQQWHGRVCTHVHWWGREGKACLQTHAVAKQYEWPQVSVYRESCMGEATVKGGQGRPGAYL